jgi:hypothetical protein
VQLPYEIKESHGKDVRDWLLEGHTYDDLLRLAHGVDNITSSTGFNSPTPDAASDEDENIDYAIELEICRSIRVDVLGEQEDGTAVVYSESLQKLHNEKAVAKMTYSGMLQAFGLPIKQRIHQGNEDVPGMYTARQVREAISLLAGRERIDDHSICGMGCWATDEEESISSVVLVGGGEAAEWNGTGALTRISSPRCGKRILGINKAENWYQFDRLTEYLDGYSPKWAEDVFLDTARIFSRWRWRHANDVTVLTGLILATWVQTLWAWRPQVGITGSINSGKTTLFDCLGHLFGPLAIQSSKSSEAGIRQSIQQTGKTIFYDEFECTRDRQKVLDMIRASGRGDQVLRGTQGQQKSKAFVLQHIIWLASRELGLHHAADRNRFIQLELRPAKPGDEGKLRTPLPSELQILGQKLLAIAVKCIAEARDLAVRIRATQCYGINSRIVECYAVPTAMLAVAIGQQSESGVLLRDLVSPLSNDEQEMSDEEDLLQAILSHVVRFDRGFEATVAELIRAYDPEKNDALERCGIAKVSSLRGPRAKTDILFIAHNDVRNKVLKGTEWANQSIDQILRRISGAKPGRRQVGGRQTYGVQLPLDFVVKRYLGDDANSGEETALMDGQQQDSF